MISHPIWTLVPWAVFAIAAGIQFWRVTTLFRRRELARPLSEGEFRKRLERIWESGQRHS